MNGITIAINKLRFMLPILPAYAEAVDQEWEEEHAEEINPLKEKLERNRTDKTALSLQWTQRSIDPAAYYREKNAIETEERLVQADLDRIACPQAEAAKALITALREGSMTVKEFLDQHVERITFPDRFHCDFFLQCGLRLREKVMIDSSIEDRPISSCTGKHTP